MLIRLGVYVSWHYSLALVEAYWEGSSSVGEPFARWKSTPTAQDESSSDKMKGTLHRSPFGMMYVPSTDDLGVELLTWFLEVFRVRTSPALAINGVSSGNNLDCGLRCFASSRRSSQPTSLLKTLNICGLEDLADCSSNLTAWGMTRRGVSLGLKIVKPRTVETECGLLPTPTTKLNELSPSMSKWAAHRRLTAFIANIAPPPEPWWPINVISGVDDGMANRVDRARATGNGQVPSVAKLAWETLCQLISAPIPDKLHL